MVKERRLVRKGNGGERTIVTHNLNGVEIPASWLPSEELIFSRKYEQRQAVGNVALDQTRSRCLRLNHHCPAGELQIFIRVPGGRLRNCCTLGLFPCVASAGGPAITSHCRPQLVHPVAGSSLEIITVI